MTQSRIMSLVEVITGSVIAFVVAIWANWAVLPLFGFEVKLQQSFAITLIFTIISIVRSYLVRRFFADIGSAGGHRAMAKAVVPMRGFREKFGDLSSEQIGERLRELVHEFLMHEPKDVKGQKSEVRSSEKIEQEPVKSR